VLEEVVQALPREEEVGEVLALELQPALGLPGKEERGTLVAGVDLSVRQVGPDQLPADVRQVRGGKGSGVIY
jgi:hypothetical protein